MGLIELYYYDREEFWFENGHLLLRGNNGTGIEAALQASGLLDAWVSPEGTLLAPDTQDTWLVARSNAAHATTARTLGTLLRADSSADNAPVAAARVEALLASIALVDSGTPPDAAEAWIATDGRYRIGPLQGAWQKSDAEHIGYAAREAARQRRLEEIAVLLDALTGHEREIEAAQKTLAAHRERLTQLAGQHPGAEALRTAHANHAAADRRAATARAQLAEAEARLQTVRHATNRAKDSLALDAEDAALPAEREALEAVARALAEYQLAIRSTEAALREHAQALVEQAEQEARAASARTELEQAAERAQARSYENVDGLCICGYEWGLSKSDQQRVVGCPQPATDDSVQAIFSDKRPWWGDRALEWPYDKRIIKWFGIWEHELNREGLGRPFEKSILQTNWCASEGHHIEGPAFRKLVQPDNIQHFLRIVRERKPALFMGSALVRALNTHDVKTAFEAIVGQETARSLGERRPFPGRHFNTGFQIFEKCQIVSLPYPSGARGLSDDHIKLFIPEIGHLIARYKADHIEQRDCRADHEEQRS